MAVSHNIYIRGLNAIYNQAHGVAAPADVKDFLKFCQIWIEVVHHHHSLEEEIMFPGIERDLGEEGIMRINLEQHHAFEEAMEEFETYVGKTEVSGYNGDIVQELVDKFGELFVSHLHDEIQNLLKIGRELDVSGEILRKNYLAFEKKLVAQSSWVSTLYDYG
jgi:hemerythrin-like domain-containing protein